MLNISPKRKRKAGAKTKLFMRISVVMPNAWGISLKRLYLVDRTLYAHADDTEQVEETKLFVWALLKMAISLLADDDDRYQAELFLQKMLETKHLPYVQLDDATDDLSAIITQEDTHE